MEAAAELPLSVAEVEVVLSNPEQFGLKEGVWYAIDAPQPFAEEQPDRCLCSAPRHKRGAVPAAGGAMGLAGHAECRGAQAEGPERVQSAAEGATGGRSWPGHDPGQNGQADRQHEDEDQVDAAVYSVAV